MVSVDEDSPPQSPQYEELLEVVTRGVAKLNIDWPAKKQTKLQKSKLDELSAGKATTSMVSVCTLWLCYRHTKPTC